MTRLSLNRRHTPSHNWVVYKLGSLLGSVGHKPCLENAPDIPSAPDFQTATKRQSPITSRKSGYWWTVTTLFVALWRSMTGRPEWSHQLEENLMNPSKFEKRSHQQIISRPKWKQKRNSKVKSINILRIRFEDQWVCFHLFFGDVCISEQQFYLKKKKP